MVCSARPLLAPSAAVLSAVALLSFVGVASAQKDEAQPAREGDQRPELPNLASDADPSLDRAARGLFDAGSVAFELGAYEDALGYFQKAYELSPRPLLLYNIATTYDRLRNDEEALAAFEKYLEQMPDAPNGLAVKVRIRLLRGSVERNKDREVSATSAAAVAATAHQPPPEPLKEADSGGGLPPWVFFTTAGATVIVGGLALWSGLNTNSAADSYEEFALQQFETNGPNQASYDEAKRLYDDGTSKQTRTNVLIGVTAGLAVASAVVGIFFTDWSQLGGEKETASAKVPLPSVWVGPNGGGAGVSHAF